MDIGIALLKIKEIEQQKAQKWQNLCDGMGTIRIDRNHQTGETTKLREDVV